MKKLPVYKIQVKDSDELGVDYVALVDKPAIERTWEAFDSKKQLFQANEEKQIVSGALIVSNLPIYRRDERMGEYFVIFDTETTMQIVQRFFQKGFAGNVNLMHDAKRVVDGVFMFESFIINSERGILTPKGHDELPDGSWFGSFKVNNPEVWKDVKEGKFKGFSVEGLFDHAFIGDKDEEVIAEIQDVIQNLNSILKLK